jgi:hypothetical protein
LLHITIMSIHFNKHAIVLLPVFIIGRFKRLAKKFG